MATSKMRPISRHNLWEAGICYLAAGGKPEGFPYALTVHFTDGHTVGPYDIVYFISSEYLAGFLGNYGSILEIGNI